MSVSQYMNNLGILTQRLGEIEPKGITNPGYWRTPHLHLYRKSEDGKSSLKIFCNSQSVDKSYKKLPVLEIIRISDLLLEDCIESLKKEENSEHRAAFYTHADSIGKSLTEIKKGYDAKHNRCRNVALRVIACILSILSVIGIPFYCYSLYKYNKESKDIHRDIQYSKAILLPHTPDLFPLTSAELLKCKQLLEEAIALSFNRKNFLIMTSALRNLVIVQRRILHSSEVANKFSKEYEELLQLAGQLGEKIKQHREKIKAVEAGVQTGRKAVETLISGNEEAITVTSEELQNSDKVLNEMMKDLHANVNQVISHLGDMNKKLEAPVEANNGPQPEVSATAAVPPPSNNSAEQNPQ